MGLNRIGEDIFITGTVSSPGFYGTFYGDGSNLTGITASGGAGVTGSGTANYIAKWTSSGVIANSNIQDAGYPNGVGINYGPQTGVILAVGNAVQPTTQYILNNYATSSTTTVLQLVSIGSGTGSHIGMDVFVPTGSNNYAIKIQDGRQASGYVLTSDASGNAYWAAPTGGGGSASSLSAVLLVGATASTNIEMNGNNINNAGTVESINTRSISTDGISTFSIGIETVNIQNMTWLNLMYNT